MKFEENGIIRFTTEYIPAEGPGAEIAPSTYAEDSDTNTPAGPAFSENVPHAKLTDNGDIIMDGRTTSVVLDSKGSQATRAENALWNLREELSLPGLVFREGDVSLIEKKIADVYKGDALIDTEDLVKHYLSQLKIYNDESSSWTFPHRHIDGNVQQASSTPDGKTKIWTGDEDLKNKLINASPRNMRNFLKIAPNAAIYGFWLSKGAPINHKISRSYSHDIIGYGVSPVHYGATKISNLPTDASARYIEVDGHLQESDKNKGKKASELLLGSVPAHSSSHVAAETILGKGTLLLGQLRALLSQDKSLSEEEQRAAFQALAHLAVLGHLLKETEWTLRSGCTLIPTQTYWTELTPGNLHKNLDIPSIEDVLHDTRLAMQRAQDMGVMGSKDDIIPIYLSDSLLNVSVPSFIKRLTKENS